MYGAGCPPQCFPPPLNNKRDPMCFTKVTEKSHTHTLPCLYIPSSNLPISPLNPTRKWFKLQFIDWQLETGCKRESIRC